VIEEIVAARQHDAAVDHHQVAEFFGRVDLDFLIRGLLFVELSFELEGKSAAVFGIDFGEPLCWVEHS